MKHRRNLSSQSLRTCQFRTRLNYGASMICSQSYGFSHSHVQMWELDHKEGRTLKNWCFRTVVLEKTLQSPLGSKEIKPVHPKGSQFSSVAQVRPTLCDPMDCSMTSFPVHHRLPELPQTHVHWVGDAIQPSHPLSSLSPPAFSLSQHQGLFQWVSSSHQWPKYWSFSFSFSSPSEYSGLISFRIDWLTGFL